MLPPVAALAADERHRRPAGRAGRQPPVGNPRPAAGIETRPNRLPSSVGLDDRLSRAHIEQCPQRTQAARQEGRKGVSPCRFGRSSGSCKSKPTMEGAGVKLHRAFGFGDTGEFDPFLLFDDFRNDRPDDYLAGFPWHPHRGIETITYVLAGTVDHGDSLGNQGTLGGRRRAVDDRGQRHPAPGDAAGRRRGAGCTASSCGRTCPRRSR